MVPWIISLKSFAIRLRYKIGIYVERETKMAFVHRQIRVKRFACIFYLRQFLVFIKF